MGKEFDEKHEATVMAFLTGETDDAPDMWARDPQDFPWAGQLCHGMTIDSAGGMCPFQAEGDIDALAADGSHVPMRWYYRSRHGFASLSVAMTQDECYGPNPLFSASLDEVDEFDYSRWTENLVALFSELAPVPYGYCFTTLAVDPQTLALHPKVAALVEEGMDTAAIVALVHAATHPNEVGREDHEAALARLDGTRSHAQPCSSLEP